MPQIYYKCKGNIPHSFDDHCCIGSGEDTDVRLKSNDFIDQKHLAFFRENGLFKIKNIGQISITANGHELNPGEQQDISKRSRVIVHFGKDQGPQFEQIILYLNQDVEEENIGHYQRIATNSGNNDLFRREMETFIYDFHQNVNNRNLLDYLVTFFRDKFKISTAIVYYQKGGKWIGTKWQDSSHNHKPSKTYFKKVLQEGIPLQFDFRDDDIDYAQSIIESKVRKVFFFPLKYAGQIWGMLYLDSKNNTLRDREFTQIMRLIEAGVSSSLFFYIFGIKGAKETQKLPAAPKAFSNFKVKVPGKWSVAFSKSSVTPIIASSYEKHIGKFRMIYGVVSGNDLFARIGVKSYIEGLLKNCFNAKYTNFIEEYIKEHFQGLRFSMADIAMSFDAPDGINDGATNIEIQIADDDDALEFYSSGVMNLYTVREGVIEEVAAGKPPTNQDFEVGDFLLASPFPVYHKNILARGKLTEIKESIKDFIMLRREK